LLFFFKLLNGSQISKNQLEWQRRGEHQSWKISKMRPNIFGSDSFSFSELLVQTESENCALSKQFLMKKNLRRSLSNTDRNA
jgi:hypothetical protein